MNLDVDFAGYVPAVGFGYAYSATCRTCGTAFRPHPMGSIRQRMNTHRTGSCGPKAVFDIT